MNNFLFIKNIKIKMLKKSFKGQLQSCRLQRVSIHMKWSLRPKNVHIRDTDAHVQHKHRLLVSVGSAAEEWCGGKCVCNASQIFTIQSGLGGHYRITPIRDPNAVDPHENHWLAHIVFGVAHVQKHRCVHVFCYFHMHVLSFWSLFLYSCSS